MLLLLLCLSLLLFINGQIPCDDEYGQHCPEASGFDVGDCLKKYDLAEKCKAYIEIHEACKDDIITHCTGKEYTGDLLVCLTEWTSQDKISDVCKEKLPKKESKEKRELTSEEKKKAEKRRSIRNKAAKMSRKQTNKDL